MTHDPSHTRAPGDGPTAGREPTPVRGSWPELGAHLAGFERVGLDDLGGERFVDGVALPQQFDQPPPDVAQQ